MKKILIIYSSGAGSTKSIVDIYSRLLCQFQVDVLPVNLSFDYSVFKNYDLLVFAFPCYHCDMSRLMHEFMAKMPKQEQIRKAFAFITYGLYSGNTLRIFVKQCIERNIYVEAYADYKSPGTDASLVFPAIKLVYRYENNIAANIIKDIRKVKEILSTDPFSYKLPRFKLYSILNFPNKWLGKLHKPQIKVRKEVCSNCHLCINSCPRDCWSAGGSYPIFDKTKCDTCYKCIHQCPQEALVFSKSTINKKKMNTQFYSTWKNKILRKIEVLDI